MCWVNKWEAHKKIAKEDMIVYKVVLDNNNVIASYYKNYMYLIGKLNPKVELEAIKNSSIIDPDTVTYVISKGYHSYRHKLKFDKDYQVIWGINIYYRSLNCCIATCIIPKGSEYYESSDGQVVSNQLIIKEVSPTIKELLSKHEKLI